MAKKKKKKQKQRIKAKKADWQQMKHQSTNKQTYENKFAMFLAGQNSWQTFCFAPNMRQHNK